MTQADPQHHGHGGHGFGHAGHGGHGFGHVGHGGHGFGHGSFGGGHHGGYHGGHHGGHHGGGHHGRFGGGHHGKQPNYHFLYRTTIVDLKLQALYCLDDLKLTDNLPHYIISGHHRG